MFSPSNPFGRAAKGTPSRAASLPSYSPTTTSPTPTQRGVRKSYYVSSHDNLDNHSTPENTEILNVEPSRSTTSNATDSDGDYTQDIITGLPDMQFVRDRHPDKDEGKNKNEYLFKNCKGITEKVSVLLKLFETHTDNGSSDSEEHSLVTTVSDKDKDNDVDMDMDKDSCSVQTSVTELSGSLLGLGLDDTKECSPLYKDKNSDVTSSEATSRCIADAVNTKVMGVSTSLQGTPAIPDSGDGESVETVSRQLIHFKHTEAAVCHRTDVAVVDESGGECCNESYRETSRNNSLAVEDKQFASEYKNFYATPVKKFLPYMMAEDQVAPVGTTAAATLSAKISDDQIHSTGISPLSVPASPSRESTPRIQSFTSSVSGVRDFGMVLTPTSAPALARTSASTSAPVRIPASASFSASTPSPCNVIPRRDRDRHCSPQPRPLVHTDTDTGVDAGAVSEPLGVFVLRNDVDTAREILCPTLIDDNSILKLSMSSPMPMPMSMLSANNRVTYSKNGNIRSHKYSVSDAETAQDAEEKAAKRLNIRCQIAHWKYQWELASYQAAKVARLLAD